MNDMTRQRIVLHIPEMDTIEVVRDLPYRSVDGEELGLDYYLPASSSDDPRPAVMFVFGYPDAGYSQRMGHTMKEMGAIESWGKLLAAHGMVAIAYENRDPVTDALAAFDHMLGHAADFNIDPARVGIWSCSANVPNALNLLCARPDRVACSALCYGYTIDLAGDTHVADAAEQFRFVHPLTASAIDAIPSRPMLIVRAGRDEIPGINPSIDRFVGALREREIEFTLFDHAEGSHAFDINDDTNASRDGIRRIVDFLRATL